jgi:hypothetical protein
MPALSARANELLLELDLFLNSGRVKRSIFLADPDGLTSKDDGLYHFTSGLEVLSDVVRRGGMFLARYRTVSGAMLAALGKHAIA